MLRGLIVAGLAAVLLAGCGSGSPTATPGPSGPAGPEASSPAASTAASPGAPTTEAPSAGPAGPSAGAPTMTSLCAGIGVRKEPATTAPLLVRVNTGSSVHVVGTVTGDAYTATTCGTSGTSWLKVDQIDGKSMKSKYGVPFGYTAAGFFQ
jgi:hypothetical protein